MSTQRSEAEIQWIAKLIAQQITEVDSDQRHLLYSYLAIDLAHRSQGFQASHFRELARREKGGK